MAAVNGGASLAPKPVKAPAFKGSTQIKPRPNAGRQQVQPPKQQPILRVVQRTIRNVGNTIGAPTNGGHRPVTVNHPAPIAHGPSTTHVGTQVTNPLNPLTPQQITAQASQSVKASYAPEWKSLNQQASQANGLDAKRAADQTVYDNWLSSQSAALQSANANIMGHLEIANQATQAAGNASVGAATAGQTDLSQQLGAETGMAMPEGGANAALLGATGAADKSLMSNAAQSSNVTGALGAQQLGQTTMNTYAEQSQVRASQIAELNKTLDTISDDKATLGDKEAADTQKAVSALQTQQANIAEYNQNYAAAQQKLAAEQRIEDAELGIKESTASSENQSRINSAKTQAYNATTARQRAATEAQNDQARNKLTLSAQQQHQMDSDRTYRLQVAKLGQAQAKDNYERTHHLGVYKPATKSTNALSTTGTQEAFTHIDTAMGQFRHLQSIGLTPANALKLMAQGGSYPSGKDSKGNVTYTKVPQAKISRVLLNAAYNLVYQGYLNPDEVQNMNAMGIYGIRARYKVGA